MHCTKVMRISRQPSPITITIDQKQLENVKCLKSLVIYNQGTQKFCSFLSIYVFGYFIDTLY